MNSLPQTTPPLKVIFKGRLEFGNQRAYDMALKAWDVRIETYFKSDILFKAENLFEEENFSMVLPAPHYVVMATEKAWRGTTDLLKEIVQYALVGKIQAWCINNGKSTELVIEPKTDKTAIIEYWTGCNQIANDGMEDASAALTRAIDKYVRHALAYERRGYVNYKLGNFKDALYDFSKSIDINPNNPEPHYGRGKVRMLKNEWELAAQDFDATIKRSIALQPIYWLARLKRGECLLHAKDHKGAVAELQLFLKRDFTADNPNFRRRRRAWYLLGRSFAGLGDANAALDAINQALKITEGAELLPESEALLQRAIVSRDAGKPDYVKDLNEAARLGNKEAALLLGQIG
jgi:tetratricopeptide (TPR) repeat protein